MLASDFGDAPDTSAGTGAGNYQTLAANLGASHLVDNTQTVLFLGSRVDSEADASPNSRANGDDFGPLADEDGLLESAQDLLLTAGTVPIVRVRATNATGSAATLYGWIDYNRDGVFSNSTERASVVVPQTARKATLSLVFPLIPATTAPGRTYARFRLSADTAAANAIGPALGGEVEDYPASITSRSDGTVNEATSIKLASGLNGAPNLAVADGFGAALASIGDLNGDGVGDLVVGATHDDTQGDARGAVYVQFLNANGTVKSSTKIASNTNGGPALADVDLFGIGIAPIGDLNGDGITDLVVGAPRDNSQGDNSGAIHVLFMNANGTVSDRAKVARNTNGGPSLGSLAFFGSSIAPLGDIDGDGIPDLAVGARLDGSGAVYVLRMNANGSVREHRKLASSINGTPGILARSQFGTSVASLGDLNGDGITDLFVGAYFDSFTGHGSGAGFVLFLNSDSTVKNSVRLDNQSNGAPVIMAQDQFGSAAAAVGDINGDGISDIAVGVRRDLTNGVRGGAVHILFMNTDGTVKGSRKLAHKTNGTPPLAHEGYFGISIASLGDMNGDGISDLAVGAHRDSSSGVMYSGAVHVLFLNPVNDYGDAPDTTSSTGVGDYQTLPENEGPSHDVAATRNTLFLGSRVSTEVTALPNQRANGDDANSLPDDEDGLIDPLYERGLTINSSPIVRLRATNLSGAAAKLYGWIDINRDGIFDNATERAWFNVPDGTSNATIILRFPKIPIGTAPGDTFARFRFSSDPAAQTPTGPAAGGEIEDHAVRIVQRSSGVVESVKTQKIASGLNGVPTFPVNAAFGAAVAPMGDLNNDGVNDLIVANGAEDSARGGLRVLFMNTNGTVKSSYRIASQINGGPTLSAGDLFGSGLAPLGDLDGDGIADFVAGAMQDDTGGTDRGAVYIQLLNANGTVKRGVKIASGMNGGPSLANNAYFGVSVASLGDLDGDGVTDIAVGAEQDSTGGANRGAVHILFLSADGTVKSKRLLASSTNGGPALTNDDHFGVSVATVGDLNGDGVADLAVGAYRDDTGGADRGAVHLLFLNADGTAKSSTKVASRLNGGPTLANGVTFGGSVAGLGDLNGDGTVDLGVGADDGFGVFHLLLMNTDGTVRSQLPIGRNQNGGPTIAAGDHFGASLASLGDLDGDGMADLAVGAFADDATGTNRGAVHILFLKELQDVLNVNLIDSDSAHITRGENNVEVVINNVADARYSIPADTLRILNIQGGSGSNAIDLTAITGAAFPSLTGITISGGAGNDTITGSDLPDVLNGGDQSDAINGRAGNDTLSGGNGDDTLAGDAGFDVLRDIAYSDFIPILTRAITLTDTLLTVKQSSTTLTADALSGFESADISGGGMRDALNASGFNSLLVTTLSGGGGNDTIFGTPGPDVIFTLSGADSINGNAGGDTVVSGSGNDTVNGGDGADNLNGQNGNDSIVGDGGNDVLVGGADVDTLVGGLGNDFLSGQAEAGRLAGGEGNDTLQGNSANDTLSGDAGDDRLFGLQGDDAMAGDDGEDSLLGGPGNDSLQGGQGSDTLQGDIGSDSFDGGADFDRINEVFDTNVTITGIAMTPTPLGTDTVLAIERIQITGGPSANFFDARQATVPVFLAGGGGNDTLLGGSKADGISGGDGDDVLSGGAGIDIIDGGNGNDYWLENADADFAVNGTVITSSVTGSETPVGVERIVLIGGTASNKLDATSATIPVVLIGGRGNDTLLGGAGSDTLSGGNRNDSTLASGDGADFLNGDTGSDVLESDPADTPVLIPGDTLVANVFALLPAWIDSL